MSARPKLFLYILVAVMLAVALPGLAHAQDEVHVVQPGETLGGIANHYHMSLRQLADLNRIEHPAGIYVGQPLVIRRRPVASTANRTSLAVEAADDSSYILPTPEAPQTSGQVILISLSHQHLYAYEDGALVLDTPITSGRPGAGTPLGQFTILQKSSPYLFVSPWARGHPYYYEPVWAGYSLRLTWQGHHIHDAPWRSVFGPGTNVEHQQPDGEWRTGSLGCVNVPPSAMPALYNWANAGTVVFIRSDH